MVISSIVFQFVMFTSTTKLRKIKSVEKKRDATSSSRIATVISLITNSEFIRGKKFQIGRLTHEKCHFHSISVRAGSHKKRA
jgi:hypothetical protein